MSFMSAHSSGRAFESLHIAAGDDLETKPTIAEFVQTAKEMMLRGKDAPIWGSAICCSHPAAVETTHSLRAIQMS